MNETITSVRGIVAGHWTDRAHHTGVTVVLTPQSQIWFSVKSWATKVMLNDLWLPGDPNTWDAYASIKFQGPAYGGTPVKGLRSGEENLVLVDRVILVKHEGAP